MGNFITAIAMIIALFMQQQQIAELKRETRETRQHELDLEVLIHKLIMKLKK